MNDLADRLAVAQRDAHRPGGAAGAGAGPGGGGSLADLDPVAQRLERRRRDGRIPEDTCSPSSARRHPSSAAGTRTRSATGSGAGSPTSSPPSTRSRPTSSCCPGCAQGAEQLGAEAAIAAGVPLVAVLPYPDPERVWPEAARVHFVELCEAAREVVVLERKRPADRDAAGKALGRRDSWLVHAADEALLVWDGDDGRYRKLHELARATAGRRPLGGRARLSGSSSPHGRTGRFVACAWASTPGGRSPTSSPTTAGSPRCRRPRPTPGDAVRTAIGEVAEGAHPSTLAHGTTVATNALLERRGATVALVGNDGFADLIEIARQDRPSLYDPWADRPEPLVSRDRRLEVRGRLDHTGHEIEPLDMASLGADPCRDRGGGRVPPPRRPARRPRARGRRGAGGRRVGRHLLGGRVAPDARVRAGRHDGGERLPSPGVSGVPTGSGRRRRRGARHDLRRWARADRPGRRPPCRAPAQRAGRWCPGGVGDRRGLRPPGRHQLRHGWHQHRRLPRPRRRAGAGRRAERRRAPDPPAQPRRPHDRRRRRLHRPARPGRRARRRATERRRPARAGVLRPRRHRAHRHRREPGRRTDPGRRRAARHRPARPRRGRGGAARGRDRRRRA